MAPIIRGSELSARFKEVATVAETGSGSAWQSFNFYTENFQPGHGLVDDDELGGDRHNLVDPTQQAPDLPNPTGQMSVPFDISQIGWWLSAMWGAPTTDDADDPVFQHVFKSGGTSVKLKSLELPVASNIFRIVDAMAVSQMQIALADEGGYRKVDLTTIQRSIRRVDARLSASAVAVPTPRVKLAGWKGKIQVDSVDFGNVLGGNVTMSNGAFMERYMDDSEWPSAVEIGRPSFQAQPQIRIRSDAKGMLDKFDGVTPFNLKLIYQISADSLIKFECPNVVAPKVLMASQGVGGMDVTPTFMASQTAAADMLTITLRNAIESYA